MSAATPDAGYTLLEVLVGLAVVALITAVAALTLLPTAPSRDLGREVAAFIADARAEVMISGTAGALEVASGALSFGGKRLALGDGPGSDRSSRLLIYADGTLGGDADKFSRAAGVPISGIWR